MRDIFNRAGLKRIDKDTRFPYEKVWDFATILIVVAIVAGFCWFVAAILQPVFPESQTSTMGLLKIVELLGSWFFWIASIGALLCYFAGWILPFFTRDQGDTYDDDTHIRRKP